MKEFRRSRRRQVADTLPVVDCMTDAIIGHIGNLSDSGMLVIASVPLVIDALYQLRFSLPGEGSGRITFEAGARLLWKEQASAPGQSWAGFRFITMSEEHVEQLRRWIEAPDRQYAWPSAHGPMTPAP